MIYSHYDHMQNQIYYRTLEREGLSMKKEKEYNKPNLILDLPTPTLAATTCWPSLQGQ